MQLEEDLSYSIIVQLKLLTNQVLMICEILTEYELFHCLGCHAVRLSERLLLASLFALLGCLFNILDIDLCELSESDSEQGLLK